MLAVEFFGICRKNRQNRLKKRRKSVKLKSIVSGPQGRSSPQRRRRARRKGRRPRNRCRPSKATRSSPCPASATSARYTSAAKAISMNCEYFDKNKEPVKPLVWLLAGFFAIRLLVVSLSFVAACVTVCLYRRRKKHASRNQEE